MANFIMYGYSGDVDFAEVSLRALKRLQRPDELIVFIDDAFEPVPDDFRHHIRNDLGVVYTQSNHPRRGNLIGPEHTIANIKYLNRYAELAKDGVCVKVDCDTLVLSRTWLDEFINDYTKSLAGGFHSQVNYMFGLCYAIKRGITQELLKDVEDNPPWIHCYEDYEISQRVHAKFPGLIRRFALAKPEASRWYCVNPQSIRPGARADVLDVNRGAERSLVLKVMTDTLNAALEADKRNKQVQEEQKNEGTVDQICSVGLDEVCSRRDGEGAGSSVCEGQEQLLLQDAR